jgi:hypothetical protein
VTPRRSRRPLPKPPTSRGSRSRPTVSSSIRWSRARRSAPTRTTAGC